MVPWFNLEYYLVYIWNQFQNILVVVTVPCSSMDSSFNHCRRYSRNRNAGTINLVAVGQVWSMATCMNASPIYQWYITSWFIMVTYSVMWYFWLNNTLFSQEGYMSNTFYRFSQLSFLPTMSLSFMLLWCLSSYGTMAQVGMSWFGNPY